jgi:hypothetical protein
MLLHSRLKETAGSPWRRFLTAWILLMLGIRLMLGGVVMLNLAGDEPGNTVSAGVVTRNGKGRFR